MRNLAVYPITSKEVEDCCNRLSDEMSKEKRVGDMRPILLRAAARIVSRAAFVLDGISGEPK